VTRAWLISACVAAVLAASAIAHATAGTDASAPAIVTVGDGPAAVATGFTIAPGRVVTVAHVLAGGTISVRGADGIARRATVVRRDERLDLAVLAVPGTQGGAPAAPRGAYAIVWREGTVTALPVELGRRIVARVRTGTGRFVGRRPALELDGAIRPGDSGAPVIGADGRLAGMLFSRSRSRANIAYALDSAAIEDAADG
jgi:S1-C subfamily serine protease